MDFVQEEIRNRRHNRQMTVEWLLTAVHEGKELIKVCIHMK